MDETLKEQLTKHWHFLVRYMEPSEALVDVLVSERVLPSTMIDDVKKGVSRREKNERLLKSIKMRGNVSYRKFLDAMMKCGQVFIADLLWLEDGGEPPLIDERDLELVPALQLSLSPRELRQVALSLDARARGNILRSGWRNDSHGMLASLQARSEQHNAEKVRQSGMVQSETKIKRLQEEVNAKNDTIRTLAMDLNLVNKELKAFTQRHQPGGHTGALRTSSVRNAGPALTSGGQPGRFEFFESALMDVSQRLSCLLGEDGVAESEGVRLDDVQQQVKKLQPLFRELEMAIDRMNTERAEALELLHPGKKTSASTLVPAVRKFLNQEQKHRYFLLKDMDRLSRKLRGMTSIDPNSGLNALRQSAVTGKPSPETVDFRFLSNHLALMEADAEHFTKKLTWKDAEIKDLKGEISSLRTRFHGPIRTTRYVAEPDSHELRDKAMTEPLNPTP